MKRVMTNLRSIRTFLNHKMLIELGWDDNQHESTVESLEPQALSSYSATIEKYEQIVLNSRLVRGFAYLEQGKPEKALKDFRYLQRLEASGMKYREMKFFSGVACVGIGSFRQAIADFESYLEKNKISSDVSFWLGVAYCGENNFNNAIKHFDSAIKDDPYFEEAYLARGEAHFKSGDWSKAEDDFSKALELNPENVEVKNNLVLIKDIHEKIQKLRRNLDKGGKE
jgi:tetratricopeptide (TPR) repeat protein